MKKDAEDERGVDKKMMLRMEKRGRGKERERR